VGGGLSYSLSQWDEVLSQYLWGSTKMGAVWPDGRHPADMTFEAAYILLSHRLEGGTRLSLRGEYFDTKDNSFLHLYANNEQGYAGTAAWIRPWSEHITSTLEIMNVISDRAARPTFGNAPRQSQTQFRFSVRVRR